MKLTSLALLVLTLTASVAYAEGSAAASISGKWSNTATHENFSINKKGIVGRNAKSCDGQVEQILSMEKGEKWLAEAAKLAAEKDIPQSQYDELAKVIDRSRSYPQLRSACYESRDNFIQISPETMVAISCSEGRCAVVHHVRAH
jgi:hypothetical protein